MSRVLLLPLLALLLTASGCGAGQRPATDLSGPRRHPHAQHDAPSGGTRSTSHPHRRHDASSARPSARSSARSSAGPDAAGPVGPTSAARATSGRAVLGRHLLPAARMPALADDLDWAVVDDGPEDTRAVGACQKTSLESIGAVSAVRRTYAAASGERVGGTAAVVVARFADARSAWRAHEVLRAWRADCAERLALPHVDVGPMRDVTVRVGLGESYRSTYGPRRESRRRTAGLGIVRTGQHLTIVEVTTAAGDYPTPRDPARVTARRVARTFA